MPTANPLLVNASAIGSGIATFDTGAAKTHAIQAVWTSGTLTALTLVIEGTVDGTTFDALKTYVASASEIAAKKLMFHLADQNVLKIRATITKLTDSGTADVSVHHLPFKEYVGF